ncbi:MAG: hypothetical protein M1833_005382 [Piccolia ochrophora]|nr:MAG: hypothetical protein M1833_005382 [Piccolia ochrophora]
MTAPMAASDAVTDELPDAPRGSTEFVESASIQTLVPLNPDIDWESYIGEKQQGTAQEGLSIFSNLPQRQVLYFDESVIVCIALTTPYHDQSTLNSYLSRLSLSLDVYAVNSKEQRHSDGASGGTSAKGGTSELIFAETLDPSVEPSISLHGDVDDEETEDKSHATVVWKVNVTLRRPRARIQNPLITFAAATNLRPAEQNVPADIHHDYLPSLVPSGINLLEPFQDDPLLAKANPRLSALRVSRVLPASQITRDILRPLRHAQKAVRIVPAVNARIKFSRVVNTGKVAIFAALDFEVTPFAQSDVVLKTVELRLAGGSVDDLAAAHAPLVPIRCRPRDDLTLLYRLTSDDASDEGSKALPNNNVLDVHVLAVTHVSDDCKPVINMKWRASVDFASAVNPNFGAPNPALQRNHRPPSLPVPTPPAGPGPTTPFPTGLASQDVTAGAESSSHPPSSSAPANTGLGVTISFTGPDHVRVGEVFHWDVFVVNRSSKPKKLALVVIPRRRGNETKPSTRPPSRGKQTKVDIADAVVDENIVYALQKTATVDPTEVICLSTDVRVGSLLPLACHTTELQFLALATGFLRIEAVRVVDLHTQESADIWDLPNIVALEKGSEDSHV